jgi:hypothetical protein
MSTARSGIMAAVGGVRSAVNADTAVLRAKNFSPRVSVSTSTVVSVRAVMSGTSTVRAYSSSKPVAI